MAEKEMCPIHPDREKRLRCLRYDLAICDHPDCAKCVQPYAICNKRKFCEIWQNQGKVDR